MLEKYIPDFDPDAFLQELAEEKQVTKKEALAMCRKAVPKEAYFHKRTEKTVPGCIYRKDSAGNVFPGRHPGCTVRTGRPLLRI